MTDKEKIITEFKKVKALGFVKSRRANNTGIGKTFEDYIGVVENNLEEPDLYGYEIKSQRSLSNSYVTLFTKSPTAPKGANAYLKDTYGTAYDEYPDIKKLHTSIFANRFNSYEERLAYRLMNDKEGRIIKIGIYSHPDHELIDSSVYYSYDILEKTLKSKLGGLFFVNADVKLDSNGKEEFHFNKAEIYETPSLKNFIKLLDEGKIMYDIRIGSYKTKGSKNYGKPHDHGSGFRIKACDIHLLYENHEIIE